MTGNGTIPASETDWGRIAVDNGAPAWAIDMGVSALRRATTPAVEPPPAPAPVIALPEFKLPQWNLPDLTLPALFVWVAGALFLLVRTGRDLVAVERLVARAQPVDLPASLRQRMGGVRVATSQEAPGPMAAGLFRPCVVLPESIALSSPGMAALLEHERAHIERRDMAVALLQRVTLALLWWSPALHWISRRIDEEREVACDEAAVERTGDAKAFARSLTKQAENQLWARAPRMAVGAIGPRSQVGRRIRRLIDLAKGVSPAKYSGRLAFAGLALAVAVAAMVTPRVPADAQQSPAGAARPPPPTPSQHPPALPPASVH
jgi:beta-lactamase regulating signal transducer with metallopeptidase domain